MKLTQLKLTRTKVLLWNALCELMFNDKKEFDTLTINDICKKAFVHRSTFYNHFADKYHLFQFGYSFSLSKKESFSLEERIVVPFETIVKANDQLLFPVLLHSYPQSLDEIIQSIQKEELEYNLIRYVDGKYDLKLSLEITSNLLSSVYTTLSNYVISGGMTATEADHSFNLFINGGLLSNK